MTLTLPQDPAISANGHDAASPHADVNSAAAQSPAALARFDLVVIGGGPAGVAAASGAAALGARVALIEHDSGARFGRAARLGFLRAARAAFDAGDAARFGIRAQGVKIDFPALMERLRRLDAESGARGGADGLKARGVDVLPGRARFTRKDRVEVGQTTLAFKKALIAAESRPELPDVPGLALAGFFNAETLFALSDLPRRWAVIGAGPEACELAQALARLGREVVMICPSSRLLPVEDAAVSALLQKALAREGVRFLFSSKITRAAAEGAEKVLTLVTDGKEEPVRVDAILAASCRKADIAELGLERAGIESDAKKGVTVDEFLQTTNSKVYAGADACAGAGFAQAPEAAARVVVQNALLFGNKRSTAMALPSCVFSDPEVARVGLNEAEAAEQGFETTAFSRTFADIERAAIDGEEEGLVKVLVEKGTDRILGATIVARHAGEMIGEFALAIGADIGLRTLAETSHPFPTLGEALQWLGEDYQRAKLTPTFKTLLKALVRIAA